jgi:tetratricopeptide (TPR) repeat protein
VFIGKKNHHFPLTEQMCLGYSGSNKEVGDMRIWTAALVFFLLLLLTGCTSTGLQPASGLYRQAYRLSVDQKYPESLLILDTILKNHGEYVAAYILRSAIYETTGEFHKAIGDLQTAAGFDGANYLVYYNLGNVYFRMGLFGDAEIQYGKSIKLNGDFASAYLNRANTYVKLSMYREALADYRVFIAKSDRQGEKILRMIRLLESRIPDTE